jgi:signal transduction histidine kinase
VNAAVIAEQAVQRLVLFGTADEATAQRISAALVKSGHPCHFAAAITLPKMHEALRLRPPSVVLLDDRMLGNASLEETLLRFTEFAPVALIAAPERSEEVSRWVARGDVEFIARIGDFAPLASAILLRRIRWAEQADAIVGAPWKEFPADFASILRHEINNPLTGILGNAELLLAHYGDKLPEAARQRVETVVDLAVRLREATRRLSNAIESERPSSAGVPAGI